MIFNKSYIIQQLNHKKKHFKPHKGKLLYERRRMSKFEDLKLRMNKFEIWLDRNDHI